MVEEGSQPPEGGDAQRSAQRILELSRQMARCAERGEWEAVTERDRLRLQCAQALPERLDQHPGAAAIRHALDESLALDERVRAMMQAERDRLGRAWREERRGQQAHDTYQAYQRLSDGDG
ncbi:flagellar protein FliT [Halorhodospira neutriphila]|uniref:flagellar protein FliT n=1 Tax=Halorhodospira neutriphila TaxID=168379 RepID=UPI0019036CE1